MNAFGNRGSRRAVFIYKKQMFPPDTGYCGIVIEPLIKTVQMYQQCKKMRKLCLDFYRILYAGNH